MTIIIAEAGVNHNGSIELAKKLIDAARLAGADYIKFQTFSAEEIASKSAKKADYQVNNTGNVESQRDMLKKLELSDSDFISLNEYSKKAGIKFLSTGFSPKALTLLEKLNMDYIKIPSGEITNILLLEKAAQIIKDDKDNRKLILSTGMSSMSEVKDAVQQLNKYGINNNKLVLFHCTTEYPAPPKTVNLRAMNAMKKEFKCDIGYSDHTKGIHTAVAAVAMGAKYIEKHFTLDKNLEGPDHKASITPNDLIHMIKNIRDIELNLGNGIKEIHPLEIKNRMVARRSIVAIKSIKKGEIYDYTNIGLQRPGGGISAMRFYEFIGREASKDLVEGEYVS